ncbi:ubiquitin carboxyl-terminal hydrolase 8-like [Rhopilema esculentum]|uniref:ubiquitin carboxyl-terminal hydrolase 8-like n=1 Tax=Rhopilema esculentum TaxID=499914 RepID=UPI0031D9CDFE
MPVPAKKKPLAVGNSISDLNSHAENVKISIKTSLQCRQYCLSLGGIFKKAEARFQDGDDENAYILYMRFLHIFEAIKKTYEYQKQMKIYNDLIEVRNVLTAVERAETLADSLKERYKQLIEDRNSKPNAQGNVTADTKKQEKASQEGKRPAKNQNNKEFQNDKPTNTRQPESKLPGNYASSLPDVPSFDTEMDDISIARKPTKVDPWIAQDELYNLLKSVKSESILILDTRPPDEFAASRVKHSNILNIREELLKPGANVNSVERRLPKDVWETWIKRGSMDYIIIMDHDGTRENSKQDSPIQILKDVIFKWDSSAQVKSEPRLLDAGFNGWQLYYPSLCTNPFYKKSKPVPHVKIPDPTKLLSSLNYPTLPGLSINESKQPSANKPPEPEGKLEKRTAPVGKDEKSPVFNEDDLLAKLRRQIDGTPDPSTESFIYKDKRSLGNESPQLMRGGGEKRSRTDHQNLKSDWKAFTNPEKHSDSLMPNASRGTLGSNGNTGDKSPLFVDHVDGAIAGNLPMKSATEKLNVGDLKEPLRSDDGQVLFAKYKDVGLEEQYEMRKHLGSIGKDGKPVSRNEKYQPFGIHTLKRENEGHTVPASATSTSKDAFNASNASEKDASRYSTLPRAASNSNTMSQGYPRANAAIPHDNPATQRSNSAPYNQPANTPVPHQSFSSKSLPRNADMSSGGPATRANGPITGTSGYMQPGLGSSGNVPLKPGQSHKIPPSTGSNANLVPKQGIGANLPQDLRPSANVPMSPTATTNVPGKPGTSGALPGANANQAGTKPPTPSEGQQPKLTQSPTKGHSGNFPMSPITRPSNTVSHLSNSTMLRPQMSSDNFKAARADSETMEQEIVTTPGLPHGWEKSVDKRTGRIYFIDHITKSTHWELPPDFYASREKETETKKQKRQAPEPPTAKEEEEPQPALKRSLSTPNLADLEVNKEIAKPVRPVVDRTLKPSQSKQQIVDRSTKPLPKSRLQNLSPVYGSKGQNLTGLKNLGNTCYMNSVIQCLSSTVALARYLNNGEYLRHLNPNSMNRRPEEVVKELAFLIKVLWSGQYRSVSPLDFKIAVGRFASQFSGTKQQDAHEFLMFFMDGIHEDVNKVRKRVPMIEQNNDNLPDDVAAISAWKDYSKNNNSVIVDLFQGQFRSTVSCKTCGKNSVTFDVFSCLPLQLTSKSACSLDGCVRAFTSPEMIGGNNSWKCSNCKTYREAKKTIELWSLPPVVVVQLKRFSSDGIWHNKLQTNVDFPVSNFDMGRHLVGPRRDKAKYELTAVVNHYGSFESGHYTAYCANQNKWFCYDDNVVSEIDKNKLKSSAAYLLFYTATELTGLQFK